MTPRDLVLEQIRHRETRSVPYTLAFEGDVAERLDAHYGGPQWRQRLTSYIDVTMIVNGDKKRLVEGPGLQRDPYGSVWRTDQRAFHLERPALPEPNGMNPYELKKRWGDKIAFWGGLGSQSIIPFGTPQQLRDESRRLRAEMSRGGGYILAPSKALQPGTPTENAVAILEAFTSQ